MSRARTPLLCGVVLAAICAPAGAGWLVLDGGERLRTRGEWRVEGQRVVYTAQSGHLTSVRLASVNTAASRALTEKRSPAKAAAAAQAARSPKAVPTFTDADFSSSKSAARPATAGRSGSGSSSTPGKPRGAAPAVPAGTEGPSPLPDLDAPASAGPRITIGGRDYEIDCASKDGLVLRPSP